MDESKLRMINFSELSTKQKKKFMYGFLEWKYNMSLQEWMILKNDELNKQFKLNK